MSNNMKAFTRAFLDTLGGVGEVGKFRINGINVLQEAQKPALRPTRFRSRARSNALNTFLILNKAR